MRRRAPVSMCIVFAAVAIATAHADGTTPEGLRGGLHLHSADTAGRGALTSGFTGSVHTLRDSLDRRHLFSISQLHLGYGLSEYAELGVSLPLRSWRVPDGAFSPNRQTGFGDLLAGLKLQVPIPGRTIRLGTAARVSIPTGSRSRGWSSETTDFELDGLLTLDFTRNENFLPFRVHANAGYRWNRNETNGVGLAPLADITRGGFWPPAYPVIPPGEGAGFNDAVPLGLGFEFPTRILILFSEFNLELHPKIDAARWRDHPVAWTQGAVIRFRNGLDVKAAAEISLQRDAPPAVLPRLPEWRFSLGITWRTVMSLGDSDQDGVPNSRDECPDRAEDFDGFQDEDGCPDLDNDADGIPDRRDLAPDLPEDFDGFEDEDGRPDYDNDGDGIRDAADQCPNEAEDFDGDDDADGCPEES